MDAWLVTFTEHAWEPQLVVLLSTAYAMVLGGLVGFERELKNRPAGFLGAGAIFRRAGGNSIAGLTTAASLLMVATIGIAAGLHAQMLALGATLITLAVLVILAWVERRAGTRASELRDE